MKWQKHWTLRIGNSAANSMVPFPKSLLRGTPGLNFHPYYFVDGEHFEHKSLLNVNFILISLAVGLDY